MIHESLGIPLQSTVGYASVINSKAEAPHRIMKPTIRAIVVASNTHNNYINRMTGRAPALGYTKTFSVGSRVKIIKDLKSQRALCACTSGDPRYTTWSIIYPTELSTLPSTRAFDTLFLGWSKNPAVSLLLKIGDTTNRIFLGHHIIVDPYVASPIIPAEDIVVVSLPSFLIEMF